MSDSSTPFDTPQARARRRTIKRVAGRLATAVGEDQHSPWTLERVLAAAGPRASRETCQAALSQLVHAGALVETEPGVWRAQGLWRGTQADWYT